MRRRRQKNPLLIRIIGISIAVHVVALPVLAYFGAFKKIQEHFVEAKMVVLPPPEHTKVEPEKAKPVPKKAPVVARRGNAHSQGSKPNPNQVHIAMAKGGADGSGEPGAQQGTLEQGVLPPDSGAGKQTGPTTTPPPVTTNTNTIAPTPPPVVTPPTITKPNTVIKPAEPVVTPAAPHVPVFTEAAPIEGKQPQPTIPDELRSDTIDTTVVVDVTVGTDGAPTAAQISQSTGKRELDRLAVDAARQWRFKPATKDGEPVESHVRLHIEFQVS